MVRLNRNFYIDDRLDSKEELKHFTIYTNSVPLVDNPWILQVFKGKRAKHITYKYYETKSKRDKEMQTYKEWNDRIEQDKEEIKRKRQEAIKKFKEFLEPGAILTDSWGYEQTNVEFYEVIAVNEKKTEIMIRELCHKTVKDSEVSHGMACYVLPGDGYSGDLKTYKVRSDGIKICSSIFLTPWDGNKRYKSWYY